MEKRFQAAYMDAVIQPLEALSRGETQQVIITDPTTAKQDLAGYCTPEEWVEATRDDIALDEVRRALSTISGSLSEAVVALRQER